MAESNIIRKILATDGRPLEDDSEILQPVLHLMSAPRKIFIRNIIPAMNYWLKVPEEIVEKVSYICDTFNEACYL